MIQTPNEKREISANTGPKIGRRSGLCPPSRRCDPTRASDRAETADRTSSTSVLLAVLKDRGAFPEQLAASRLLTAGRLFGAVEFEIERRLVG